MGTRILGEIALSSARVQLKAANRHGTLKRTMLKLLAGCLLAGFGVVSIGCAAETPASPNGAGGQPQAGVAARIDLSASAGFGSEAGTGSVSARVLDAFSTALGSQTVRFTASTGTLRDAAVVTDEKGFARTSITGQPDTVITITAATGSIETKTQVAMQLPPPPLPAPGVPPPAPTPIPPSQPTPATPTYSVTVTASATGLIVGGSTTLTATATPTNGAPASPATYEWDCDGNGTVDATTIVATTNCTYPAAGTFSVSATAKNGTAVGSGLVSVTVAKPTITVSCDSPKLSVSNVATCVVNAKVGLELLFPNSITTVEFDWGDGTARTTVNGPNSATHAYAAAITYPVIATATVSGVTGIRGTTSLTVQP